MPQFRYRALGPAGEMQRGVMDAASEADVVTRLQRQGYLPMRTELADRELWVAALSRVEFLGGRALRRQDVADLMRELATMLTAGRDLDRALRYLEETAATRRVRAVVTGLRDSVRDGSPLATALARLPRGFSRLDVALVRAGEASGQLAPTLAHLADLLERQQRLIASIISALIYPCLLVLAAIGSVTLLLTQVLPQFVPLFAENGAKLPSSTQTLLAIGGFLSRYGIVLLLAVVVLTLIARAAVRLPPVRLVVDRVSLRLPIIGGVLRELLAARFTRVLGTLLVNGVPIITALGITRDAVGNHAVVTAIDRAITAARSGASLCAPLAEARVFPLRTSHLLRVGEEHAELGPMALRAAEIHEERTRLVLQRLVALLVPAITILMGAAVAAIVGSLLTAMLSLNDLASN